MTRLSGLMVLALLLAAPALAQEPDAALVERGVAVYEASRCALCHAVAGTGNAKGPLDGVGARLTAEQIERWIVSPAEMTAEANATRRPAMRAYPSLPEADLEALVAYMLSLKES